MERYGLICKYIPEKEITANDEDNCDNDANAEHHNKSRTHERRKLFRIVLEFMKVNVQRGVVTIGCQYLDKKRKGQVHGQSTEVTGGKIGYVKRKQYNRARHGQRAGDRVDQ